MKIKFNQFLNENTGDIQEIVSDVDIKKVNKAKGIMWSIGLLKKHKIHIVHNINAKREQENYKWREINGICINEPIDKYNHFWDACRYAYISNYVNSGIQMIGW